MADTVPIPFDAGNGIRGVLHAPRSDIEAMLVNSAARADRALARLDDPRLTKRPPAVQVQETLDAAEAVLAHLGKLAALGLLREAP